MFSIPTLVSLFLLAVPKVVLADPCVAFDVNFNLLAFGFNGKDYSAGPQSSWSSGSADDITTTGRPPFDGANTTCYLAQFFNAIYVMNGDKSNPSDVHIYNAGAKSWSTQKVTTGSFDPSSFDAILDHDTNVFYAVSKNVLFFLDMGSLTSANSTNLAWVDVAETPYSSSYQPVMALAENHIHFLDVPGNAAGVADIFVIHFSFFQPQSQSYSGATFPATHGQATSFFQSSGVQQEFAFIPDDFSSTYVINVESNTTTTLAPPTTKDTGARYAASINALVQLDSTGAVSFIPYTQGDVSTNAAAAWSSVAKIAAVAPAGSSSTATGTSGATQSGSATKSGAPGTSGTGSASGAKQTGSGTSGALDSATLNLGALAGALVAAVAALL